MKYILLVVLCFTACKDDSKTYVVVDRFDDKHKYDRLPDTDSMTVYCQLHYEWENIQYYYTEEGVKYWIKTLKYF
tara:strand:+ start:715 stop:939 length:225 start_codon:yes stop_codon:yes gene_type:complete